VRFDQVLFAAGQEQSLVLAEIPPAAVAHRAKARRRDPRRRQSPFQPPTVPITPREGAAKWSVRIQHLGAARCRSRHR
jgi:hypothetical protein